MLDWYDVILTKNNLQLLLDFKNTSKLSSKEQPSHSSCEEGNVPQAKRICSSSTGDAGTDIATMEELSVFCRWEESGHSEEHFMEIVYLKQANAESIYSALVEFLKDKGLPSKQYCGHGF